MRQIITDIMTLNQKDIPMFMIESKPYNYYISVAMQGDAVTVTLDTHDSLAESITLDLLNAGTVVPITHSSNYVMAVCYLPKCTIADVSSLAATTTLFITSEGACVTDTSIIKPHYKYPHAIHFVNPRDCIYHVIPNSQLDTVNSVFHYKGSTCQLMSPANVFIQGIAVFRPTTKYLGLYTLLADARDALAYTDLEINDVLRVNYTSDDIASTEYVKVN